MKIQELRLIMIASTN